MVPAAGAASVQNDPYLAIAQVESCLENMLSYESFKPVLIC